MEKSIFLFHFQWYFIIIIWKKEIFSPVLFCFSIPHTPLVMLQLCNALSKRSSLFYRQIKAFSTTTTNCMIFDSLEEQKIPLNPTPEAMNWYSCGPTVYNHSHVGHARNYVSIDIVQRIFQNYFNKNLFIALGVTDIDDKIINTSNETKKPWKEVSQMYEESYFKDMTSLNVQKPHAILRVSEHIPDIIEFIKVCFSIKR